MNTSDFQNYKAKFCHKLGVILESDTVFLNPILQNTKNTSHIRKKIQDQAESFNNYLASLDLLFSSGI